MQSRAVTSASCCVATFDGNVYHGKSVSAGFDVVRSIISELSALHPGIAGVQFTKLAPQMQDFESARANTDMLIIYEVPVDAVATGPSTSQVLNLGSCLDETDSVNFLHCSSTSGHRILAVHWNTFKSADGSSRAPEKAYLNLLGELAASAVQDAPPRVDRTGTGTFSVFGRQARFDISGGIPLLTTKKLAWKKVLEELLWFARGETDVKDLQSRGVHIWDGNSSRAFLDQAGLSHLPEGDIGPAYGFQWRHFGAQYRGAKSGDHSKYVGEGMDQLARVERELKENPHSRRIFMSAWNARDVDSMALPPCHVSAQFYAAPGVGVGASAKKARLSCHLYQRSVDTFLGFPWNIASYSMLTHILATRCGMEPGELVVSTGDTHLYTDHVHAAEMQLARSVRPMPCFLVAPDVAHKDWHEMSLSDFDICGYYPHPFISAPMSV